jgi:hypothetical protein
MDNALFYVAKDLLSDDKNRVVGVAMWMPPRSAELKETWGEWWEGWKLWVKQVGMNSWYGRGGLNVKASLFPSIFLEDAYSHMCFRILNKACTCTDLLE